MPSILISSSQPKIIVAGTEQDPIDVTIQNISANTIYLSFNPLSAITEGLKISSGQSYTNDVLNRTLYALADVDASEVRVEVQKSWFILPMPYYIRR